VGAACLCGVGDTVALFHDRSLTTLMKSASPGFSAGTAAAAVAYTGTWLTVKCSVPASVGTSITIRRAYSFVGNSSMEALAASSMWNSRAANPRRTT
jgi:hypothetical protein